MAGQIVSEKRKDDGNINASRSSFFDIIKALSIISIVAGHCIPDGRAVRFVYTYHLAVFFFASGLQFRYEKYCDNPALLIGSRMKAMWPPYFWYLTFFTITHDLALQCNLIRDVPAFGWKATVYRVFNNLVFSGSETLGGAMWFVPVLLIGVIVFGLVVYASHTYFYRIRFVVISLVCCGMGFVGLYGHITGRSLARGSITSMLLIPMMLAGFLVTNLKIDRKKLFRWFLAIPCLIFVCWFAIHKEIQVNLAARMVGSDALFYPVSFCGIYLICWLAKELDRFSVLTKVFAFIGKHSFDIMALHFLIFKLVDLVFGVLTGADPAISTIHPYAFRQLWPLYLILGTIVPPFIRVGFDKLFGLVRNTVQNIFAAKK